MEDWIGSVYGRL